ncbi:MAG: cytochrome c3 family protein, partial [Kofleriaceae bacterium]
CTSCHALSTGTVELRPPRGHAACTGKGCHATTGAPAPAMSACEACHARGRAEERLQLRLAAPWSVRGRFVHAPHRQTRDGREVACTTCHDRLTTPDLRSLEAPSKSTCAGCHDGATSFKLTGTSCTRCHPGSRP